MKLFAVGAYLLVLLAALSVFGVALIITGAVLFYVNRQKNSRGYTIAAICCLAAGVLSVVPLSVAILLRLFFRMGF